MCLASFLKASKGNNLDSDGKLSIKSNMNDWHLIISDNVCTKINYLI